MATTDSELIAEVRAFAGYESTNVFSDSDIQEIIDIAKEEILSDLGTQQVNWYTGNHDLTRALFWFTCIGLKVKDGEIGSADIDIDEIRATDSETEYDFWFKQFQKRLRGAAKITDSVGAGVSSIERDERDYGYDRPNL